MSKKPKPPKPDRTVHTRLEDSLADRVGQPRGTMVNFVMRFNVYNRLLDIKQGRAKRGRPSEAQIKEVANEVAQSYK
jgi:hypothetical protein